MFFKINFKVKTKKKYIDFWQAFVCLNNNNLNEMKPSCDFFHGNYYFGQLMTFV